MSDTTLAFSAHAILRYFDTLFAEKYIRKWQLQCLYEPLDPIVEPVDYPKRAKHREKNTCLQELDTILNKMSKKQFRSDIDTLPRRRLRLGFLVVLLIV